MSDNAPPTPPPPSEEKIARLAALAALNESIVEQLVICKQLADDATPE